MAKILLIDDDSDRLAALVEELRFGDKHDVIVASDVDEAFAFLTRDDVNIELIILDLILNYGDKYTKSETLDGRETGYCLLKDIREARRGFKVNRDIPVIVLTNIRKDGFLKDKITGYDKVAYLEKPVTFDQVYEKIDQLLE